MAESPASPTSETEDDDSEWEYEYHETETEVSKNPPPFSTLLQQAYILETFYVTLDVSSAGNQIRTRKRPGSPPPESAAAAASNGNAPSLGNNNNNDNTENNTTTNSANDTTAQQGIEQSQDGNDDVIMSSSNPNDKKDGGQPSPLITTTEDLSEPEDRIQILDLHSPNPIISYQNQIYSCEWTSTIGTDVLLSKPDPDFPHPVLKEVNGVSIIAATGIKLFGRPVQISPRPDASAENKPSATATEAQPTTSSAPSSSAQATAAEPTTTNNNDAHPPPSLENEAQTNAPTPIKIPTSLGASAAREKQARFLERLIAIKAAKGEKDEVTVYAQKVNQRSGWRSQQKATAERRASEAAQVAQAEQQTPAAGDEDDDLPPTTTTPPVRKSTTTRGRVGRPRRGSWRKSGPRTQKGGLFRDYRPQLFDTEGADIRASIPTTSSTDSVATPDTWDQLHNPSSSSSSAAAINKSPNKPPRHHPPRASSPKTALVLDPRLIAQDHEAQRNRSALAPAPAPASIPVLTAQATTTSSGAVATGYGVDAPSPIDDGDVGDEGRRIENEGRGSEIELGMGSSDGVRGLGGNGIATSGVDVRGEDDGGGAGDDDEDIEMADA